MKRPTRDQLEVYGYMCAGSIPVLVFLYVWARTT